MIVLGVAILAFIWLTKELGTRTSARRLSDLQVAEAWLQCIDCQGSFLKRLNELPANSKDTVTRFLRSALLSGPDSARVRRHTRDMLRTWQADSIDRVQHRLPARPSTQLASLLARYQRSFEVLWRGRAATALGVIRTSTALAALDDAFQGPLNDRGDSTVRRMVERAKADSGRTVLRSELASRGSIPDIGRVRGIVVGDHDAPVANAAITLLGTAYRGITGATGEYTLTRIPAGTYSLEASRTGYRPKTARIAVSPGETLVRVDTLHP
jgi:hypothetical protein